MAKKITAIVSLSIIGLLIIATLVMANVDVNHAIKFNKPDKIFVQYSSGTTLGLHDDEHYDKIIDSINNASKETSLTALFNGTINDKPIIVTNSTTATTIPTTSGFYVNFSYSEPQKLMDGNKAFKDENGKNYYYRNLIFTILMVHLIPATQFTQNTIKSAQIIVLYIITL